MCAKITPVYIRYIIMLSQVYKYSVFIFDSAYFAAGVNIYRFATMSQSLDKIPNVDIDDHGRFKYILITMSEGKSASKEIVRGYARAQWHGEFIIYYDTVVINFAKHNVRCGGLFWNFQCLTHYALAMLQVSNKDNVAVCQ